MNILRKMLWKITGMGVSKVIVNYKYIICQQKLNKIYSYLIICFILTPFSTLPYQPLLPSPLKLHNFTTPNETLMSVWFVCVQIWHLFHICDRKDCIKINFWVFNYWIILLLSSNILLFMNALNYLPIHSNVQRWNFLY